MTRVIVYVLVMGCLRLVITFDRNALNRLQNIFCTYVKVMQPRQLGSASSTQVNNMSANVFALAILALTISKVSVKSKKS